MPLTPKQKVTHAMMRLMARLMPSCKDIAQLVSRNLDQKLPLHRRLLIRLHVSMCALCRRYEKQVQLLHQGAGHYADPERNPAADSLSPAARERLKQALGRGLDD